MGSFNVGCGISNLSINQADKIGFTIMDKVKNKDAYYDYPGQGQSYFVYSTDNYKPFLPPIFGEYGDYGMIVNIEESATTKILEEMFRRPIQTVMECIIREREIYSDYGHIFPTYSIEGSSLGQWRQPAEEVFLSLGLTKITPSAPYGEAYTFKQYTFVTSGNDTWGVIKTDDSTIVIPVNNRGGSDLYTLLNKFAYVTKMFPGFHEEDWGIIQLLFKLSGMFFLKDVYLEMKGKPSKCSSMDLECWENFKKAVDGPEIESLEFEGKMAYHDALIDFADTFLENSCFPRDSRKLFTHYSSPKEFSDMDNLIKVMDSVNRMFAPSFNGDQHGNDEASLKLQKFTNKILKARIAEYM